MNRPLNPEAWAKAHEGVTPGRFNRPEDYFSRLKYAFEEYVQHLSATELRAEFDQVNKWRKRVCYEEYTRRERGEESKYDRRRKHYSRYAILARGGLDVGDDAAV